MLRNTANSYGLVSKLLHWTIAVLIFSLIGIGWYMVDLTYYDRWYNASLSWHKSLGMLVLLLGCLFGCWKLANRTPDYPPTVPRWQQVAATVAHHLLLAMMLLIPVTGYLISTSAGKPVEVFSWVTLPALFPVPQDLRDFAIEIHYWCAYGVGLLALGHAGAALKHQFIDKDGVLGRML
jgi:cytochrome b561